MVICFIVDFKVVLFLVYLYLIVIFNWGIRIFGLKFLNDVKNFLVGCIEEGKIVLIINFMVL